MTFLMTQAEAEDQAEQGWQDLIPALNTDDNEIQDYIIIGGV